MNDAPISIEQSDDTITIRGEVDAHTAPMVRTTAEPMLNGGTLRIELSGVEFIDSSGLGVLVALTERAREQGGDLIVVAPSRPVVRLLQISGLDGHITTES